MSTVPQWKVRLRWGAVGVAVGVPAGLFLSRRTQKRDESPFTLSLRQLTAPAAGGAKKEKGDKKKNLVGVLHLRGTFARPPSPPQLQPHAVSGDGVERELRSMSDLSDSVAAGKTRITGLTPGRGLTALVLRIDSPGGSPLEASRVFAAVKHYKAKMGGIPVVALVDSACASAGYYVACAADEIVCNPHSVVGSVGVVGPLSYNVERFLRKKGAILEGVDLWVQTAGKNKLRNNPFLPRRKEDERFLQGNMEETQRLFVGVVRRERGDRLRPDVAARRLAELHGTRAADEDGLFDGCFYVGRRAVDVGFADAVTALPEELWLRERYGEDAIVASLVPRRGALAGLLGLGLGALDSLGLPLLSVGSIVDDSYRLAQDHELWTRFGLTPPR